MATIHPKPAMPMPHLAHMRMLCAALSAVILFDVAMVRAPGLALLAVPFIVGAARMTGGHRLWMAVLAGWSGLFVAIGVAYASANHFDAPAGDLVFAYAGTPLALALVVSLMLHFIHKRPA
jgi:hypothetical protein